MRVKILWFRSTMFRVAEVMLLLVLHPSIPASAVVQPSSPANYGVRVEETWISMKDGVRLAVNLFMPTGGKPGEKFPALLEYLPYRKDDGTIVGDYGTHAYFAHFGYVGARVDIRGTGRSEGSRPDREYSRQEQEDGLEVIAWLAKQPWSNGNVGMFGISWGGFNSVQLAMRHPPALKAIIAACATDRLFHDDVHFIDGMMHVDQYELEVDLETAMTQAPDFPIDERSLAARFDSPPWFLTYKSHARDGAFWQEPERPLESIGIPVFLIGGLYDGYRDSIPVMLERIHSPVKAIIGPWNHNWPDNPDWGPKIEWRDQALRWWDQWLKGKDTGIAEGPRLTVYMRHWYPPKLHLEEIPGEWRTEQAWPPKDADPQTYYLQADRSLAPSVQRASVDELKYIPSVGVNAGGPDIWWGELTPDQRPDDAFSLVYDSAPLENDVAVLGFPRTLLQASATAKAGNWFVRLSDIAPDGSTTLVTGAGLNGAQRDSATEPSDLELDRVYQLDISMHFTSWVFPRGHRIRLAVSNALWPMIWPTPYAMTTSLHLGGQNASRLLLPVVPARGGTTHFALPQASDQPPSVKATGNWLPGEAWIKQRDEIHDSTKWEWRGGEQVLEFPWGRKTHRDQMTFEVADTNSAVSSMHGDSETTVQLSGRILVWRAIMDVHSDEASFYCRYKRQLEQNGQVVRERTWDKTIPRDHQ